MSRYTRIKFQTNVAISWLIETASAHGSNVTVVDDITATTPTTGTRTATSTKTGRLKGKVRKEAKKMQEQPSQPSRTAYKVSTEEILRQARYLENLHQDLVMSKPTWNAFKEAVRGREEYTSKFSQEQPEHEGNAGHVYFLDVLRRVVDMIGKVVRVQENSSDNSVKEQRDGITLHNLFAALQDVELAGNSQATLDADTPLDENTADSAVTAAPSARYEPTIDPKEEVRLRWYCFQVDADSIISWVVSMWDQYLRQCEVGSSLESTSLLSDLALELLYKLEEEMEDIVGSVNEVMLSEPDSVRDWLSPMMALSDVRYATREAAGYPVLVKQLHKRHPELELDRWNDFAVSDRKPVQYLTELKQEMILRYNGWEENGPPRHHDRCISKASLDAVSRSLSTVTHGGCRGTKELIAMNVLRGIWGLQSANADEPFHHVARIAEAMFDQFEQYFTDGISFPAAHTDRIHEYTSLLSWTFEWPGQVERYLNFRAIDSSHRAAALSGFHRDIWKHFDYSVKKKEGILNTCKFFPDHAGTATARLQHGDEYVMPPEDSHFLRKSNPLMPGKLALNLQFLRTEIGFDFGNGDPSLFLMCHLYNALRQLGYLDVAWKSLDTLIAMHIKALFLGALPTVDGKQMFNRACIAFGFPPELIRSRNSKNGREKTIKNLLGKREKKMDALHFPPIMAIVADHLHDREPLRRTLTRLDAEMVAKHFIACGSSRVKPFLDEENPIAFLDRLRTHVDDFHQYFAIDCIELTRVCSGLLEKIRTDEMTSAMKVGHKQGAYCVALLILAELDGVDEMTRPGMPVPKTKFATEAAALLKDYIQSGENARAVVAEGVQNRMVDSHVGL